MFRNSLSPNVSWHLYLYRCVVCSLIIAIIIICLLSVQPYNTKKTILVDTLMCPNVIWNLTNERKRKKNLILFYSFQVHKLFIFIYSTNKFITVYHIYPEVSVL
ncbi:hypothetical protein J3Q64DRAFT_1221505 [Phycomyces blakesleeanus]|uniref:Uncharacterized protein n=1 Tax=Phycomyces blakesleeanus TaxID=4837 RepID=A0ABR3BAZ1_PHYBL